MNEKALALFDAIKLKNINENLDVIALKDCICYESGFYNAYVFGDTGVNTPFAIASRYKNFLDCNYEMYYQLDRSELSKRPINSLDKEFDEVVTFNIRDLNIFNSIISAGKSNYIAGKVLFEKGKFSVFVYGLTYTLKYSIMKIIPESLYGCSIDFSCDTFYMFYKLLRDKVDKKKTIDINVKVNIGVTFNFDNIYIEFPLTHICNTESLSYHLCSYYETKKAECSIGSPEKVNNKSISDGSIRLFIKNDSIKHLMKAFPGDVNICKVKNKKSIFVKDDLTEMFIFGDLNE